ncbi:MAG: hypothetical protein KBT07_01380 [Clostridiales bacterium]|nr:hypothetical protein [Candidatus Scatonaster coprocaballi]
MDALMEELCARREMLLAARAKAEKMLEGAPEGKVRVSTRRGKDQYYLYQDSIQVYDRYMKKEERPLAEKLVCKDYADRLIRRIDKELRLIATYIQTLEHKNPNNVYEMLSKQRQKLVSPILLSPKLYVERWMKQTYDMNPAFSDQKLYETKRGEKVRSKSELMFANLYYELDIPYRYESKLTLRDGTVRYPDFTLLDVRHRRYVFHEHFGLMDDPEYREACFRKLDLYRRNGVYLGVNLIATFEGKGSELNMREIRQMMRELFGV